MSTTEMLSNRISLARSPRGLCAVEYFQEKHRYRRISEVYLSHKSPDGLAIHRHCIKNRKKHRNWQHTQCLDSRILSMRCEHLCQYFHFFSLMTVSPYLKSRHSLIVWISSLGGCVSHGQEPSLNRYPTPCTVSICSPNSPSLRRSRLTCVSTVLSIP